MTELTSMKINYINNIALSLQALIELMKQANISNNYKMDLVYSKDTPNLQVKDLHFKQLE